MRIKSVNVAARRCIDEGVLVGNRSVVAKLALAAKT